MLGAPCVVRGQDRLGWEASAGVAIPRGRTAASRRVGPAAHLALRVGHPASNLAFGVLADVGFMPGETIATDQSGNSIEQSSLRIGTFAATAHLESPAGGPGAFGEIGAGVSWITQTNYPITTKAPMLLAGAGVRAPVAGIPLRLGLQYHLYVTDIVEGTDNSLRIYIGVGRR